MYPRSNSSTVASTAAFLMLACSSDLTEVGTPGTTSGGVDGSVAGADAAGMTLAPADAGSGVSGTCERMDVLFIVDDSGSMREEQSNLIENFPRFVATLDEYRTDTGVELDYRIGVTTTSRPLKIKEKIFGITIDTDNEDGPDGALLSRAECGMDEPWIGRADGDAAEQFSCIARVGTRGVEYEQPLAVIESALVARVADGSNVGFVRDDALLAIVVLTDEDDCSSDKTTVTDGSRCAFDRDDLIPVDRVLTTVDGVKGDRGRWAAAVVAGAGPGNCSSEFGSAREGVRLRQFTDGVGENAVFSSICEGDLSVALDEALRTFEAACRTFTPLI